MSEQPITKKPVLFQTLTGLFIGLVCFNPLYETLKFVLEKKDFFEVEWPALVSFEEKGLIPILLGLPYFTIQRAQIIWYTLQIPEPLLNHYQTFIPHILKTTPLNTSLSETSLSKEEKKEKKVSKIVPFPIKKNEPDSK